MSETKLWKWIQPVLPWAVMVAGSVVVAWGLFQATRPALAVPPLESDPIFDQQEGFGLVLRRGLRDARVVVPGRPHPLPFRGQDPEYADRITKRTTFTCSTNAGRFRGVREYSPVPDPDVVRIVTVGDSITFGHGVNDDETYPHLLQERLGAGFEVINAGVPGENSDQALMDLTERILPLGPQLVIVCVGVNEISSLPQRYDDNELQLWLSEDLYRIEEQEFADNLRAIEVACTAAGVELVFLVPPSNTFSPYPDAARFNRVVRQVVDQVGVTSIDLEEEFRRAEERNGLVLLHQGDTQSVVRYRRGRPETLLTVDVAPTREQFISDEVYDFLDREPVAMTMSMDGCHPTVEGMRLIVDLLEPVVEGLFGDDSGS